MEDNIRNQRPSVIDKKGGSLTLTRMNDAILRFIIQDLQPFHRIESSSFRKMIAGKKIH